MKSNNRLFFTLMLLLGILAAGQTLHAEDGVTDTEIMVGGVMDLEGRSSGLGLGMKAGIEAALQNQTVAGHKIRFLAANDSYTPDKTVEATHKLIARKVLLFAGNVGTPTAQVALPLLEEQKIPAVGFFTGAGLLRPGKGDILNFRASYVQETQAVINKALQHGVQPSGICAYVQNDAYGMAGVNGILQALKNKPDTENTLAALQKVLEQKGDDAPRNSIGPVGVYTRNTFTARKGYDSLKAWEKSHDTQCRLVITVGAYEAVARFIAYAAGKGEPWIYSAVSFTGADNFLQTLDKFDIADRVIMTQVVPLPDSNLPIVKDARQALGKDYGYVSQEGYIVGRLLLHGLKKLAEENKPITRSNFMTAIKGRQFDLDGLDMNFTDDNQGSDFVVLTALSNNKWVSMPDVTWANWLKK